jgi:histone arginine demethylase JMJD6
MTALENQYAAVRYVNVIDRFSETLLGKEPLVFTSIMQHWNAYAKWNLNFLKTHYSDHLVLADRIEGGESKFIQARLSAFIEYMRDSDESNPFYAKTSLHMTNDFKDDYSGEPFFSCWYRRWYAVHPTEKRKINLSNMYLGPRHATSPLHIDIWGTSFWNALFEGEKLWIFFMQADEPYIYDGKIDPFKPDLDRFPLLKKTVPLIHTQRPGDLVYCPGNIYHAVYVLEPSLAISENFINEENFRYVLDSFRKSGHHRAYEKMLRITEAFMTLESY